MKECEAIDDLLPIHAVGETSVEEGLLVEEHLATCGACRGDLALYGRISETARGPLASAPEARAPETGRRIRASRLAAASILLAVGLAAGIAAGRWFAAGPAAAPGPAPGQGVPLSVFSPTVRDHLSRLARS